jgi:hypothetical protein
MLVPSVEVIPAPCANATPPQTETNSNPASIFIASVYSRIRLSSLMKYLPNTSTPKVPSTEPKRRDGGFMVQVQRV